MTWKIPANYPSLESFSADQRTKLTGNNNANYIHLLIRAITPSRNESFSRGTVERKDTSRAWNGEGRLYDIFACRVSLCDQNGLATRRRRFVSQLDPRTELIGVLYRTAVRLETSPLLTAPPFPYFHHYSIACDFFDRKNFCKNCPTTSLERKIDR